MQENKCHQCQNNFFGKKNDAYCKSCHDTRIGDLVELIQIVDDEPIINYYNEKNIKQVVKILSEKKNKI